MRSPHAPVLCLALILGATTSAQFTPGRLAVLECSGGSNSGSPYTIREFDTNGVPGVVFNVPTTGPNAAVGIVNTTWASQLVRTPSGDALLFPGFGAMAPTGTILTTTSSSSIPRVVCRVDHFGNFTWAASTSTYYNGSTMYGVASDGAHVWGSGGGDGVVYLGPGTPAQINNESPTVAALGLSAGVLYGTSPTGVFHLGETAPTTPTLRTADFPPSFWAPQDVFVTPDGNTAYTSNFSRVEKWQRVAGTWTHMYDLMCASGGAWLVRITVDLSGPFPVIYGVHNVPTKLVKWVDNGAGSPEQLLYTPPGLPRWYGIAFTPANTCPTFGQPCDDNDPGTVNDEVRSDCVCRGEQVHLAAKIFLEGPFNTVAGTMLDALRGLATFPQTEPYTALGVVPTSGSGAALGAGVLSVTGNNAIVDWVLLELRDAVNPAIVLVRVPALLQRDGDVVALDGVNVLSLPTEPGAYHIAMRHRNHLPAMTLNAVALGDVAVAVDFTLATTPTYGTNARKTVGSVQVLWAGDVNCNGQVKYAGGANDRDPILSAIGGSVPTATVNGQYRQEDLNMNSQVRYAGGSNDRDLILQNIGGNVPTAVRNAQLP